MKAFDVFISYSSTDNLIASAIKHHLEEARIRCWMAPDNIPAGASWPLEIMKGIQGSSVMLLLWTKNSMHSKEVAKELTLCMNENLLILPFRVENIPPSGEWLYHLSNTHWMDAFDGKLEEHITPLVSRVKSIIPQRDDVGGVSSDFKSHTSPHNKDIINVPSYESPKSKIYSVTNKYTGIIKDSKIFLRGNNQAVFLNEIKGKEIVDNIAPGTNILDVFAYIDESGTSSGGIRGLILTNEFLWLKDLYKDATPLELSSVKCISVRRDIDRNVNLFINDNNVFNINGPSFANVIKFRDLLREITGATECTSDNAGSPKKSNKLETVGVEKNLVKKEKWLAYTLVVLFGVFGYFYTSPQRALVFFGLGFLSPVIFGVAAGLKLINLSDTAVVLIILFVWYIFPIAAIPLWGFRPGIIPKKNT